jgi:hypothetical protein
MTTERRLYVTKNWVVILFIYYTLLFLMGILGSIEVLINQIDSEEILMSALLGSISISLSASAIAYIRKLYKLCFSYSSEHEDVDQLSFKRLGTMFYFFTRPLYAVLFSLLIVIGCNSGMLASSKNFTLDSGFIYITMFFSFYAGFLSGDFIKKLEESGKKQLGKLVK